MFERYNLNKKNLLSNKDTGVIFLKLNHNVVM